jgi:hypothetical protein
MATSDPFDELHRLIERGDEARAKARENAAWSHVIGEMLLVTKQQCLDAMGRFSDENREAIAWIDGRHQIPRSPHY